MFEIQTIGETIRPSLRISVVNESTVRITVTGEWNQFYTVESSDSIAGDDPGVSAG